MRQKSKRHQDAAERMVCESWRSNAVLQRLVENINAPVERCMPVMLIEVSQFPSTTAAGRDKQDFGNMIRQRNIP
ncbi:MAG TPA: hypothetical protein ENH11_10330 [Candidatus Acetothermia bacterium]|nr:hypothetical protein [Candidatus Acetothermia bacterium]